MIVSVHIAKTAGNSFRECLAATFGERVLNVYGDWAGCELPVARERSDARAAARRALGPEMLERYDVIHGHFVADTFLGLFPRTDFVAFFRDPYQQTVAHYNFLLRNPQRDHPEVRVLHEEKMTLHDYIEWTAFRNHQTQYLGSLAVDDLAMVGLSNAFSQSLDIFRARFGVDLGPERYFNVNETQAGPYLTTPDVKRLVETYRAADIEVYRHAVELFAKQVASIAA